MAFGLANLEKLLNQAESTTAKGLIRIMTTAEVAPLFESDAAWAEPCDFATGVDEDHGIADDYRQDFRRGETSKAAIEDNHILAAIAAYSLGLHYDLPMVAWRRPTSTPSREMPKRAYPSSRRCATCNGLARTCPCPQRGAQ
jgi:hypothetical protein